MTATRIELLRRMAAFGGMKEESLEAILAESKDVEKAVGDVFFSEGDTAESFFILESGNVNVLRDWEGEPVLLSTLGAGDCFGEMSLIDFQKRSASVVAKTDCCSIEISRNSIAALCKNDLQQYTMIMMNLGREVSRRLRKADQRLFELRRLLEPQALLVPLKELQRHHHITS
ncbi:Crp/Fnr family transcriptional regulator [Aporhodopirellula aestuarii]|uniref:Cyclic nucleotide-binding domain-containing protein n=1 Tax=Aporhodopirellula aestuarii TaxID=2950107 RepID=A0ABT0U8E4_9BACT|nr:cyclic nucleotide-binding domain-containing protein [Aporhodopirellula aestuarii]MCM2373082.1 cyclic nucleotide-binding domain-containing protein [Aporhodopirellula aestuarii]